MLKIRQLLFVLFISILFLFGFNIDASAQESASITATISISICGNRSIEGGEVCDTNVLGNVSCNDFGYERGELGCSISCQEYDLSNCFNDSDIEEVTEYEEEVVVEEQLEEETELLYENVESESIEIENEEIENDGVDGTLGSTDSVDLDLEQNIISNSVQNYMIDSFGIANNVDAELPP